MAWRELAAEPEPRPPSEKTLNQLTFDEILEWNERRGGEKGL
jgi:hypothetical protein